MNIFHYRPSGSYLHRIHPLTKLTLMILLSTLSVTGSVVFAASTFLFSLILALTTRLPVTRYGKEFGYFTLIIILVALARYLSSGSVLIVARTILMFTSMILLSIILMDTTGVDEVGNAVAFLFTPLGKKRRYHAAAVIELTLMMIPLFLDAGETMFQARIARGERFSRHPVRSVTSFAQSLLTRVFRDLERLEGALNGRMYQVEQRGRIARTSSRDVLIMLSVAFPAVLIYSLV